MSILKTGFNKDISNESYHEDREYTSSSALKLMYKNPREYYRKYVLNEKDKMNAAALDFGSYLHAAILEPHTLETDFAVFTGASRRGKVWEAFEAENKGKIIITKSMAAKADLMLASFREDKIWMGSPNKEKEILTSSLYIDGTPEETLCGELNGYKVKTRFDYRTEYDCYGIIKDIKTTKEPVKSCHKHVIENICAAFMYDLSAALYVDLAEKVTGKPHDFYFTFLSKDDNGIRTVKASEQMLASGRKKYVEAIEKLKIAKATGVYYRNIIEEIDALR